ncbi:MAG: hypothetical protein H6819_07855 [Phycisphaerales bacterium]|nr:hypothetical protein [Phycisphaerales bacterium]MCB9854311.1 hypothetical protein [Phycisphaerales bacterium]MCB9863512.1 hypothetical protein [Phycisphaerales bacterium]
MTALVISRTLATGREAALMAARQAAEEAEAIRKQREAVFEEMARASSDVDAIHG